MADSLALQAELQLLLMHIKLIPNPLIIYVQLHQVAIELIDPVAMVTVVCLMMCTVELCIARERELCQEERERQS